MKTNELEFHVLFYSGLGGNERLQGRASGSAPSIRAAKTQATQWAKDTEYCPLCAAIVLLIDGVSFARTSPIGGRRLGRWQGGGNV